MVSGLNKKMPMASAKKVDVPKKYGKILRFGTKKWLRPLH